MLISFSMLSVFSVVKQSVKAPNAKELKPRKLFAKHILRKVFLEDWAMKLTALVITFGLWFGVTGLSTPIKKRFTSVPLNIVGPNDAEITSPQTEIEIEVSGPKHTIDQINRAELNATIDLTEMPPGDRVVTLMPENVAVNLPDRVKLVEVFPIRITAKLETIEEKDVEVRAQTVANPSSGFEVYSASVFPQNIRVRGPSGFIKTLEFIETVDIDLSDRREDFTARQIPVTVANPKAAVQNTVVDVLFRIGEKRIERSFTIPLREFPGMTARFVLYGPKSLISRAKSDMMSVDYGVQGDDTARVILPAEWPDVVEVRDLTIKR